MYRPNKRRIQEQPQRHRGRPPQRHCGRAMIYLRDLAARANGVEIISSLFECADCHLIRAMPKSYRAVASTSE